MHWLRAIFSVYGRREHSVQFLVHTALSSIPSPIHVCRAFSALIHLHLTQKNVAKARAKGAYGEEVTLSFQSLIQYYTVSPGLVYTPRISGEDSKMETNRHLSTSKQSDHTKKSDNKC